MIFLTRGASLPPFFSLATAVPAPLDSLRIGIAESLVRDVNVSDARAAMAVWMSRIVQDLNIELRYPPQVFEPDERLAAKLRLAAPVTVAVNVISYRRMFVWRGPDRGRRLGAVIGKHKPNQVALPVFFSRADVCSYLTLSELNPQVATRLRPLAVSPEIVSGLYAFRRGWHGFARDKLLRALVGLHRNPAGRQALNLFQCESLAVRPSSCLKHSLEILTQAERNSRLLSGERK